MSFSSNHILCGPATNIRRGSNVMRLSVNWLVRNLALAFIEFIRNTPQLVQIIFWYLAVLQALHDVEIVIDEKHLRLSGGILFVDLDERVDAALITRLRQVPVEIILPKDARITFVREDERVRQ